MSDANTSLFFGGAFAVGDAASVVVRNPATNAVIAEIRGASAAMSTRAADANALAARGMRALSILKRVELCRRLAAGIRADAVSLAALVTAESAARWLG